MEVVAYLYGGEQFRSELEARWAVFFDALQLRWRYERGGFDESLGAWLPSMFGLPGVDRWIRVEPWPSGRRDASIRPPPVLWTQSERAGLRPRELGRLIVLYGAPMRPNAQFTTFAAEPGTGEDVLAEAAGYAAFNSCRGGYRWTQCPRCQRVGIEFEGRADQVCCCFPEDVAIHNVLSRPLRRAYERAGLATIRTGRLWHGLIAPELRRVPLYN